MCDSTLISFKVIHVFSRHIYVRKWMFIIYTHDQINIRVIYAQNIYWYWYEFSYMTFVSALCWTFNLFHSVLLNCLIFQIQKKKIIDLVLIFSILRACHINEKYFFMFLFLHNIVCSLYGSCFLPNIIISYFYQVDCLQVCKRAYHIGLVSVFCGLKC